MHVTLTMIHAANSRFKLKVDLQVRDSNHLLEVIRECERDYSGFESYMLTYHSEDPPCSPSSPA